MSEDDCFKLNEKLNQVLLKLAQMDEKLIGYPALLGKVDDLNVSLELQKAKCKQIQDGKIKFPLGAVAGSLVLGIIMLVVGYFFAMLTK